MDFTEVIESRYSCKKYGPRPISDAQLNAILAAGRVAPTAKNLQEQRIYVARSAEALAKIDKITPCRYGAPTVLVVAYNKEQLLTCFMIVIEDGFLRTVRRIGLKLNELHLIGSDDGTIALGSLLIYYTINMPQEYIFMVFIH